MTEELFREDSYAKQCQARVTAMDQGGIRLDRTVFYPMGGGQPGDTGVLRLPDGSEIRIADTVKAGDEGDIVHVPETPVDKDITGQQVEACIDWDRRHRLMRMHTLMHLLCAVVPAGVTGGSIRDGSGRLDFDLPESTLDKEQITTELNRLVEENHPVQARWITDEELEANPELVRTMSVKPPMGTGRVRLMDVQGIDLQPCGGTHVACTGEIGRVRVRKIEKKGKHNRRVNLEFAD
jgi:misacylated tRNA(Ala) deacylase